MAWVPLNRKKVGVKISLSQHPIYKKTPSMAVDFAKQKISMQNQKLPQSLVNHPILRKKPAALAIFL
ncbi:hypothetical protein ACKZDW_06305 (plasmid) [Ralstonia syzygii subsp. celebesensis]